MDGNELNIWKVFKFFNEGEFEKLILSNKVLKSYEIFNEKISLNEFRNYDRFGDVLMIDKDFKYWSIGEVEISGHSFSNHIFPQLIELYNLIETYYETIQLKYVKKFTDSKEKRYRDLILYNKPFLTLVIDEIPVKYKSSLELLRNFCNIHTVKRVRTENEDYLYIIDSDYSKFIDENMSTCFINENVVVIDYPNILGLNENEIKTINFKDIETPIHQQFQRIKNKDSVREILFYYFDGRINNGRYYARRVDDKLILNK